MKMWTFDTMVESLDRGAVPNGGAAKNDGSNHRLDWTSISTQDIWGETMGRETRSIPTMNEMIFEFIRLRLHLLHHVNVTTAWELRWLLSQALVEIGVYIPCWKIRTPPNKWTPGDANMKNLMYNHIPYNPMIAYSVYIKGVRDHIFGRAMCLRFHRSGSHLMDKCEHYLMVS